VEYRVYQGEGHGFTSREAIVDFSSRALDFLAENLDIALDNQGRVTMDNGRARSRADGQAPVPSTPPPDVRPIPVPRVAQ